MSQRKGTGYCQHSCSTTACFSYSVPQKPPLQSSEEQRAGQMALHPGRSTLCSGNAWCGRSGKLLTPVLPTAAISRELSSVLWLRLVPVPCRVPPQFYSCCCPSPAPPWHLHLESDTGHSAAPDPTLCRRYSGSFSSSFC